MEDFLERLKQQHVYVEYIKSNKEYELSKEEMANVIEELYDLAKELIEELEREKDKNENNNI